MLDRDARVLVTGGAGFIGSHIAERLARDGSGVRVLDDFSTGQREWAAEITAAGQGRLEVLEGDIRDRDTVRRALQGVTHVVHLAAIPSVPRSVEDPFRCNEVGVTGTLILLEEARDAGVRRFVYAVPPASTATSPSCRSANRWRPSRNLPTR